MSAYTQPQTGNLIVGGFLLGAWIFLFLMAGPGTAWAYGGLLGLALSGASYGTRFVSPQARAGIMVAVGVATGFGLMVLMMQESVALVLSFLWTTLAGLLVVSGLPRSQATSGWTKVTA